MTASRRSGGPPSTDAVRDALPSARAVLVRRLAATIAGLDAAGTVRVAVDGVDGAGKSTFADELAASLPALGRPVVRASIDGFHNPRLVRYRQGRDSPDGFYEDSYDYRRLRTYLLDPLSPGGDGWHRATAFDVRADRDVDVAPVSAPPRAILVLDGIFLHRPELAQYWDFSVFLRVSFEETFGRMAVRDGGPPDPYDPRNRRYLDGQRRYLENCRPEQRATVVIDNEKFDTPTLVRVHDSRM